MRDAGLISAAGKERNIFLFMTDKLGLKNETKLYIKKHIRKKRPQLDFSWRSLDDGLASKIT
jgi:hypothetical protein